jgi:S1-C subfamily serine protease
MSPRRFASSICAFLAVALAAFAIAEDPKPPLAPEPKPEPVAAAEAPTPSLADSIAKGIRTVTDKAGAAICLVEAEDEHGRLAGSGFLLDAEGIVVTTQAIGAASDDLTVTLGEQSYPAKRLVADSRSGIALLKIHSDDPLPCLKAGKAMTLGVGEPVVALGYPLGLPLSPSFGVVAGFNSGFQGRYFATRHVRVNAAIQRGEGGAPLLNMNGEVVGVLISSVDSGSGLFALPIEAVEKVLHDFRTYQRVRPGWLGADVRMTDAPEGGSNARLRALRSDGPGAQGKLRAGDVLLQVGRWKITSPDDVFNAAFYITASEPLEVKVSRAGKVRTFTVVPTDPPDGAEPKIYREEPAYLGAAEGGK